MKPMLLTRFLATLLGIAWLGTAGAAEPPPVEASPRATAAPADTRAAEEAARAWLALVDDKRYADSWAQAAALFRQAVPKEKWVETVTAARTPVGKLSKRELHAAEARTSLPGAPDGEYVVLQFDTGFENKAAAVETVTPMRDPDGRWRVAGYYIR
jgi:hypothetical protein